MRNRTREHHSDDAHSFWLRVRESWHDLIADAAQDSDSQDLDSQDSDTQDTDAPVPVTATDTQEASTPDETSSDTGATTRPVAAGASAEGTPIPLTRHDGLIESAYEGQVISNLDIYAEGENAVTILHDNVTLVNCRIHHQDGNGIAVIGARGVTIENTEIVNAGAPEAGPETDTDQNNITVHQSGNLTVTNVTLREGSSGIYLIDSPGASLTGIEGYDFHGPMPRGQLVQFDKSGDSTLDRFYVRNDPDVSWVEDNVSVYESPNVTISNGVIDGNNSPSGVGVMFEEGSTGGQVSHVDAIHMGNGAFSSYNGDVAFDFTRSLDNILDDQGRGEPLSGALIWNTSGEGVSITNATYANAAAPENIVWGEQEAVSADVQEGDVTPQAHWSNDFLWA